MSLSIETRVLFVIASIFFASSIAAEPITEAQLRVHIEILASDEFEGRKPGTTGENKTINYIATQWARSGLEPAAGNGRWYQPVKLIERTPVSQSIRLTITRNGRDYPARLNEKAIVLRGGMQTASAQNLQVLLLGHEPIAEDALEELVAGRLVFIQQSVLIAGKDIPDYRTRKRDLIKAGASAVVGIVNGRRRWDRFARRYRATNTALDVSGHHAPIEGLIYGRELKKLIQKTGVNASQILKSMRKDDFQPTNVDLRADISVDTRTHSFVSHNVLGKITGSKPENGALLFLGHWDHFGECGSETDVDRICNGAVDNASGMALLIEVAKRLAKTKPDRDVYFLGTTAEESGLLGARAFVSQPSLPLKRLIAAFNADTVAIAPDGKLLAVVGRGKTDLDSDIEEVAKAQGLEIDKTDRANAFIRRQDAYEFLKQDIPAFMITSAFSDRERLDAYLNGRYHDASDEADEELELGGATSDANFHVALGEYFGNLDSYPAKAP